MAMEVINTGKWTIKDIEDFLNNSSKLGYPEKFDYISNLFLDIKYNDRTLIGTQEIRERLVINFKEVDCFTYIDYVLALSMSKTFDEFKERLRLVRYKEGILDFKNRRHFFTDWSYYEPSFVDDVTQLIGRSNIKKEVKLLNFKRDNNLYLEGLPLVKRIVYYIPTQRIDNKILNNLKTGDFIGIFSREKGLDVSHVGIIIKKTPDKIHFRHASSVKKKVVEQDFLNYISRTPGIVVLRLKE